MLTARITPKAGARSAAPCGRSGGRSRTHGSFLAPVKDGALGDAGAGPGVLDNQIVGRSQGRVAGGAVRRRWSGRRSGAGSRSAGTVTTRPSHALEARIRRSGGRVDDMRKLAVVAGHVAQAQLVGVADRSVRQHDVDRVAHRLDGKRDVGAQEERRRPARCRLRTRERCRAGCAGAGCAARPACAAPPARSASPSSRVM